MSVVGGWVGSPGPSETCTSLSRVEEFGGRAPLLTFPLSLVRSRLRDSVNRSELVKVFFGKTGGVMWERGNFETGKGPF